MKMKSILQSLLVALLSTASFISPVMAEDNVIDTTPVEGIEITTPTEPTETEPTKPVEETQPTEPTPSPETSTEPTTNTTDKYLKDNLYEGDILIDQNFSLDNFFERLIVKMRGLVENVRRTAVPFLVLAWIIMFVVAILRIVSGERGVSASLVSGMFFITVAYIGVVSAEGILYSLAHFIVG